MSTADMKEVPSRSNRTVQNELTYGYLVATKFKLWSSLLTCRPLTPCPLPWGEGGRRPGEGSVADEAVVLGGLRLLLTYTLQNFRRRIQAG